MNVRNVDRQNVRVESSKKKGEGVGRIEERARERERQRERETDRQTDRERQRCGQMAGKGSIVKNNPQDQKVDSNTLHSDSPR